MYVPREGTSLVVDLPGERLQATVHKVVDHNIVIAELTGQPLMKSHSYRKGDFVAVQRRRNVLGETWDAIEDRVLHRGAEVVTKAAERVAAEARPKPKSKPKRVVKRVR
jgi:hypothetical protein